MATDPSQSEVRALSSPLTTSSRVAQNLFLTAFAQGWSILLSIITVPVIVRSVGPSAYGLYLFAWLVVGYAALLDIGLTAATVRGVSIQRSVGDMQGVQRTVSTAMASLMLLAVPGGGLLFLVSTLGMHFALRLPTQLAGDGVFVFAVVGAAFAINACMTIFLAVIMAMQQFRLAALQAILSSTLTAAAQVAISLAGLGLRWLVVASFAIFALSLTLFIRPSMRLLPGIRFVPRLDAQTFRSLITFGGARFGSQVLLQLAYGVDRLVIAATMPIVILTYYGVPLSVTQKFVVLQTSMGQAFFPSASELHGLKSGDWLRQLYLDVFKLAVVVTLPAALLVGGLAGPILNVWLGPIFASESSRILSALAFGYGLIALMVVTAQACDATGHVRWTLSYAASAAGVTTLAAILLVHQLGAIGGAFAVTIGVGGTGIVYAWLVQRRLLHLEPLEVFRYAVIRPALAAVGLGAYCLFVGPHLHRLIAVVLALVIGLFVYGGLTLLTGTWTTRELSLARRMVMSARGLVSGW